VNGYAADQPAAEPLPPAGQPAPDRPGRPAQLARRLLSGQPLEVAEHEGHAIPRGQPAELLVQRLSEVIPSPDVLDGRLRHPGRLLVPPAASGGRAEARGRPPGDLMEPGPERAGQDERARPPGEDEEGGLEGVLGGLRVPEGPAADPEHHRPVAVDEHRERELRPLAVPPYEPLEELRVRALADGTGGEEHAEMVQ
jgi:hypothetical protein